MKLKIISFILAFWILGVSSLVSAEAINTTYFGDLAVEGYDVVAYFTDTENAPIKGKKKFTYEWMEANWRFSSEENRELFKADPEKYAPQYGGYCAYAVGAKNATAGIEPEQFTLIDGKLYLNYNAKTQDTWTENRDDYIITGDKNWPSILADLQDE